MHFIFSRYFSSLLKHKGFTLLELLVVISIISLLASLSTPSILGYINFLRLRAMRASIISDIQYLVSASQKYGGNCNVNFLQLRTNTRPQSRFAASLKCFQDSAELQLNSSSSKNISLETNDIYFLTNTPSLQVGNHGAIVGSKDYLFIVGYRATSGLENVPLCFTLARYNSSVKLGTYSRSISNLAGPYVSKVIPTLSTRYCI